MKGVAMAESKMKGSNHHSITRGTWVFLTVLLFLFLLFLPVWPYSLHWGYYPASGFGFSFLVFLILLWMGAFAIAGRVDSESSQ